MSRHFPLSEMQFSATATRLGLDNTCPQNLMANMVRVEEHLEEIRAHFGNKPVKVLSCYRSPAVNIAVVGSKNSAHIAALAVDFTIPGVPLIDIANWCGKSIEDADQVILEFDSWIHLGFTLGEPRKQLLTAIKDNGKTIYVLGFKGYKL